MEIPTIHPEMDDSFNEQMDFDRDWFDQNPKYAAMLRRPFEIESSEFSMMTGEDLKLSTLLSRRKIGMSSLTRANQNKKRAPMNRTLTLDEQDRSRLVLASTNPGDFVLDPLFFVRTVTTIICLSELQYVEITTWR